MPKVKARVYASLEEARVHLRAKDRVFEVSDPANPANPQRSGYVVARTHPLARAAAALAWGVTCSTVGHAGPPPSLDEVELAVQRMSEEERASLLATLNKIIRVSRSK